jgi:thiamine-phosphate pyrophosphorylase
MHARLAGIYAIVDASEGDARDQVLDVLSAGIRVVQYRAKTGVDRYVVRVLRDATRAHDAVLIVNDDLGAIDDADGVHLGQEDLQALDGSTLRAAHPDKIIGISCPDIATARQAQALGADYLGVGSMYATASKADAGAPIGADGVRAVVRAVDIPVAAIGGITRERIPEVRATGAAMAAVITAISRAPDRRAAARALVEAWEA